MGLSSSEHFDLVLFAGSAAVFSIMANRQRKQQRSRRYSGNFVMYSHNEALGMSGLSIKSQMTAGSILSVATMLTSGEYTVSDVVYHKSMDFFFTLVMELFDANIKKTRVYDASEIPIPTKDPKKDRLKTISFFDGRLHILDNDEFIVIPLTVWYGIKMLNHLPFDDRRTDYITVRAGKKDLNNMFGHSIPRCPEGWWRDPTGDVSMKRLFFSGMAMLMTQKCANPTPEEYYVADISGMEKYVMREGYENLGCKAYFDEYGNITKITDRTDFTDNGESTVTYRPGHEYWQYVKLKVRTAAFAYTSVVHLVEMHYVWGAIPASALRMFLQADHPVRRAFTAHFFKTLYTVVRSTISLFHQTGLLFRGLGLDYYKGLAAVVQDMYVNFEFATFPDMLKSNNITDCDFMVLNEDGMDSYNLLTEYVSDIFDAIYPNQAALEQDVDMKKLMEYLAQNMNGCPKPYTLENVKCIWGEIVFRVTAMHNVVGDATWCSMDPRIINARLQERRYETMITPEEGAYAVAAITATTTVPCPTIDQDWSHMYGDHEGCKAAHDKLHINYKKLDEKIEQRNKTRQFNVVVFQSENITLSVAS